MLTPPNADGRPVAAGGFVGRKQGLRTKSRPPAGRPCQRPAPVLGHSTRRLYTDARTPAPGFTKGKRILAAKIMRVSRRDGAKEESAAPTRNRGCGLPKNSWA